MLTTILDEHRDLPAIAWLVAPVGGTLVGRVDGPGPADQVRAAFGSLVPRPGGRRTGRDAQPGRGRLPAGHRPCGSGPGRPRRNRRRRRRRLPGIAMGLGEGALAASPPTSGSGLLEKLLAAVRPEFRVDVYVPDPNDPVFGPSAVSGARLRPVRLGIRIVRRPRHPLACPRPPGPERLPRRPGSTAAGAERAVELLGARLPVRHQRIWAMHAPPQQVDRQRSPGPGGVGSQPSGDASRASRAVSAAVLHPVGGKRPAPVLQIA